MTRLARGEVISGKYRIERTLSEGSATSVFQARHVDLGHHVAIKLLRAEPAPPSAAADRFRGAARAAARLQGAHVCRVLDVGTHLDGAPLVVMEYLEGLHLGRELELHGPMAVAVAVRCVLEACDAVGAAHACGIIHTDLKPSNLFWATQPDGSRQIKVIGFGVPKAGSALDPGSAALSATSSAVSSPAYMAPEQLDATQGVDERTDVWALAVVLYELISGRPPFEGDSLPALVGAVLNGPLRPLAELHPGVPAALDDVLARALRRRRDQRYGGMAELVAALLPFADAEPVGSRSDVRLLRAAAGSVARSHRGTGPREQQITRSGRTRYGAALAALVLLCIGALLAFRFWRDAAAEARVPPKPDGTEAALHGTAAPPQLQPGASLPAGIAPASQPGSRLATQPTAATPSSPLSGSGNPSLSQPPVSPAGPLEPSSPAAPATAGHGLAQPTAAPARAASLVAPAIPKPSPQRQPAAPQVTTPSITDFGGRR